MSWHELESLISPYEGLDPEDYLPMDYDFIEDDQLVDSIECYFSVGDDDLF